MADGRQFWTAEARQLKVQEGMAPERHGVELGDIEMQLSLDQLGLAE